MDTSLRNRFMPKIQSITLVSPKEQRVNPSRSSSAEKKRIKFNQNYSYYQNKVKGDADTSINRSYIAKEESANYTNIQKNAKFIEYSEFNIITAGQQIIAISYFYPQDYPEQLKEKFDHLLEELKGTINRRFPFIQLLLKPIATTAQTSYGLSLPTIPLFEVQMCSFLLNQNVQKIILYSMELTSELPKLHSIISNIRKKLQKIKERSLRNVDLVVQVDCVLKDAQLLGPNQDSQDLLEGLQITLRQKTDHILPSFTYKDGRLDTSIISERANSSQFVSKINIPSIDNLSQNNSICRSSRSISNTQLNMSQSRSSKSITFSQRSIRSSQFNTLISQTSIFLTSKASKEKQSRNRSNSQNEQCLDQTSTYPKESNVSCLKKNQPIKVYSAKTITNSQGCAVLKNIPLDIDQFYLEISGSRQLKSFKSAISLKQLYNQQNDGILRVCYDLEREDLCIGNIVVKQTKTSINDATIKIGNYEFWKKEKGQEKDRRMWFQQLDSDGEQNSYPFFCLPGSFFIEITKEGCYPDRRQIHFKRGVFNLDVNLVSSTLVRLTLKTKNLITQQLVGDLLIRIVDEKENKIWSQETDNSGIATITLSLTKKIRVYVEKENFVKVYQDIVLSADMLEHDIFVIPQNENVHNRLDILIHEPSEEFKMNYQLVCPGFNPVNQHNTSNMVYGASYDYIKFKNGGKLIGISVQQLNDKIFELEAFSILQKPNVKENFTKQMYKTFTKSENNKGQKQFVDENDASFIDLYSRTHVYPNPATQQKKYEEHQKVGRNFCKAVQSINGFFYNQRLSTTPLKFQKNLKDYVYVNEQVCKFTPEKSTRVYVIFDNKLLNMSYINQNVFVDKKRIGLFDSSLKTFIETLSPQNIQIHQIEQVNQKEDGEVVVEEQEQMQNTIPKKMIPNIIQQGVLKESRQASFYQINSKQQKPQMTINYRRF